ncbi:MAG: hypothetical protein RL546_804, partial [Chloroflexota bacterium]
GSCIKRRSRSERGTALVVNDLRVDVIQAAEDCKTRTRRITGHTDSN